jgi:predicted XRE-type DNA-binding protein
MGSALYDAQKGEKAPSAKPFKGVGSGVFEIAVRFKTDAYRLVYAVQIGTRLCVLHAFQKKIQIGCQNAPAGCRGNQTSLPAGGRNGEGAMSKQKTMEYEMGSGNVFADLELDDADELLTRAQLGHTVRLILAKKKLRQREIATLLGIDQAEVSKLMNGQYHLFSEGRLFGFLTRLNKKVG